MYHSLLLACPQSQREMVAAELYELGTLGITERDRPGGWCELEAFFAGRFDEAVRFGAYGPQWREYAESPEAGWVDTFEAMEVGERLYLAPSWRDDPAPPGRLRLAVHARQASGSGYQPATRLALEALERHLRPGDRFLDAGTGSGILSAAAALLGAGPRFACDMDLAALSEARENETPAHLWGGSPRSFANASADVVAANLNAEALLGLAADLMRVLAPGGRLIVSGFTARNADRILRAFPAEPAESLSSGLWRAIVLTARPAPVFRQ